MIYTVGNYRLDIPESGTERKIRTPRQVVPYRDVAETCRTIDALLLRIQETKSSPLKIVDGIARSGFWSAVFVNRWPDCDLLINEVDDQCFDTLKRNFSCQIEANNIYTWTPPPSDILLLDFDDFTLRKCAKHKEVLSRIAPTTKWLLVADNTCFGFKFGNLRHYGVDTEKQYYELLDREMRTVLGGKRILAVSSFLNAAMVLYSEANGEGIEYLPPSQLFMSRGDKQYKKPMPIGFGLCGQKS